MVRSILTLTYRKSGKVKTVWEMDCLQSPPAEASWSFRHVVPSHQLHYPMVPGLDQFDSTRWIQNESKALRRKSLKVFDSGGFSSLAIARSQLQTPTVAWQRSSILLCDLVLATWTSGWLQWIQNGFKMRMWNYGVMCNELICCSFGHASCVPRKKAASEWFAQRETKICDKHLSYWWPWIAQRHYHNSLCCASFALRSFCVIFLWTWRQKFLHKWRLATQLQPHGSSKSSSMVWFTQVVDVVVIVVDLTQHATSAWSSSNLKVWHFWISTGQKIGKTWNHRNFMKWKCSWMQSVENTSTVYSTQHEF